MVQTIATIVLAFYAIVILEGWRLRSEERAVERRRERWEHEQWLQYQRRLQERGLKPPHLV
jgi:hypothetical protein